MKARKHHKALHIALTVVYILSSFSSILTYLFVTAPPADAANVTFTINSSLRKDSDTGTLFGSNASIGAHQIAFGFSGTTTTYTATTVSYTHLDVYKRQALIGDLLYYGSIMVMARLI